MSRRQAQPTENDALTFKSKSIPLDETPSIPGYYQCVHFVLSEERLVERAIKKLEQWFEEVEGVNYIDSGKTGKGNGFIVLEWEECEIDPSFLTVLQNDSHVIDFSVYLRSIEE